MIRQYEGMFLVNTSAGEGDKALEPVRRVLDRSQAEVLVCKRWDERKLAYEVDGQKRGIYVLTYFKVDGGRIADIERDVQLSDDVLRVLVLSAEDVTEEQMNQPTPAETGHSPDTEPAEDFGDRRDRDRGDRGDRGGRRRRDEGDRREGDRRESGPRESAGDAESEPSADESEQ